MTDLERLSEQCDMGIERRALYALLHEADKAFPIAVNLLRHDGDDFRGKGHAEIFKAALDLWDVHRLNDQFDTAVFLAELRGRGELRRLQHILPQVLTAPEGATNWGTWERMADYCRIITRDAAIRRVALGLMSGTEYLKNGQLDAAVQVTRECLDEDTQQAGADATSVDRLLAELLDTGALENIPALEPLIADTLFMDTLARIFGESGSFKSFVALDFAGCVGTGKDWHGAAVRQGTVVYIVAEGVKGVRKRVRAWEQHYGRKMTGVKFLPRPVQVKSPEWAVLIEACRRLRPVLVIIDTQARVTVGVEENSATEMGIVNELMERLRAACEACVLVVHHSGVDASDRGRGSSSVKGVMQTELSVSRKGKGVSDTLVTIKTGKQKDDEDGGQYVFALERVEIAGEAKPDGSPVTSIVLVPESVTAQTGALIPGTDDYYIALLDQAEIPLLGRDKVRTEAAKKGIVLPGKNQRLSEILRIRRERHELSPRPVPTPKTDTCPQCGDSLEVSAGHTCPLELGDRSGQASPDLSAPSPSLREGAGGQPGGEDEPDPS